MKKLLLVFCVLLSACGGGGGGGSESSSPQPAEVKRDPTIVFIGDSMTEYWPLQSYYPEAINEGIGGQSSDKILARFSTDVIRHKPAKVVILVGTATIASVPNPDSMDVWRMAEIARLNGIEPIICLIPPIDDFIWSDDYPFVYKDPVLGRTAVKKWNDEVRAIAIANGWKLVDYYSVMVNPNETANAKLSLDGVHPNKAGYDVMWATLKPVLMSL